MVEHRHSTSGAVHSHTPGTSLPPWSTRIPAAIEKGEDHLVAAQLREVPRHITELELALAKALWAWFHQWQHDTHEEAEYPRALIDFTEKVERLT